MKKPCRQCGQPFEALSDRGLYCGGACRAAASRKRRAESAAVPLGRAALLIEQAQEAIQEARAALKGRGEER